MAASRRKSLFAIRFGLSIAIFLSASLAAFNTQAADDAVREATQASPEQASAKEPAGEHAGRESSEHRPTGDRRRGVPPRGRRFSYGRDDAPVQLDAKVANIERGFVFVGGVYAPPPYTIEARQGALFVNDQAIDGALLPGDRRDDQWTDQHVLALADSLRHDEMLLALPGQPAVLLSPSFDGFLLAQHWATGPGQPPQLHMAPLGFDHAKFHEWLARFMPSPDLKERSAQLVDQVRNARAEAESAFSAVRRRETVHYLATVAGMVLSVLATGHLLQYRPAANATQAAQAQPEMLTMASRSLVLVTVLSSFDLFWTLMAAKSGAMTEINPLGSHLLSDPSQLVAFKATITLSAVGLLFFLRRHHQAQRAAWWACLICTMLMFRWLTFNSMFLS